MINDCASSPSSKNAEVSLVKQDDPIFDKRFQSLSLEDIDLENFWINVQTRDSREAVMLPTEPLLVFWIALKTAW
ncbi:MAG: hypothetical protein V3U15_05840 [Nitrospinota bacterium]